MNGIGHLDRVPEPDKYSKPVSHAGFNRMFDRYTEDALDAMRLARQEALRRRSETISLRELAVGLLRAGGVCSGFLMSVEIDPIGLADAIAPPGSAQISDANLPFEPFARDVLRYAVADEASNPPRGAISTGHLLLGVLNSSDDILPPIFREAGVEERQLRAHMSSLTD